MSRHERRVMTKERILGFAAMLLFLTGMAAPGEASANKVTIFEDKHFGGDRRELGIGSYATVPIGNDEISSIKIDGQLKVIVYEHENFQGRSTSYCTNVDIGNMGWWHDEISSLQVTLRHPECISVYEHENYQGERQDFDTGYHDLGRIGMGNDDIDSVVIPEGMKVTLFEDEGFGGDSFLMYKSAPDLGWWHDEASGLRVELTDEKGPYVELYEHPNFGGFVQHLPVGKFNQEFLYRNDTISSVKIPDGYMLILFENKNFTGSRHIYYGDSREVQDFYGHGVQDTASSLIVAKNEQAEAPLGPLSAYNTDFGKLVLMYFHAPRVYLAEGEPYEPSSVQWALDNVLERYRNEADGKMWLRTKEPMNNDATILDGFSGNVSSAKVYAFLVERDNNIVDVIYYMFYPYNRGKRFAGVHWGNHVGDWEHMTVRFRKSDQGLDPFEVHLSAHDFGMTYQWSEIAKVDGHPSHPIVYEAWGSHGLWKDTGGHHYKTISYALSDYEIYDNCSQGKAWDTWKNADYYHYNEQRGIGTESVWPKWMSSMYIYRWGNTERACVGAFGVCGLENGPTGPVDKGVWKNARPGSGIQVAIKTHYNTFLTAPSDGSTFTSSNTTLDDDEIFTISANDDGTFSFKTFIGKYMLAFQGGGHFHAWSDVIGPRTKFRIIDNADNTISLITHEGKYATTWGHGGLMGSDTPLEGSKFRLVQIKNMSSFDGERVSMRTAFNTYVKAPDDGGHFENQSTVIGNKETFVLASNDDGTVSFKTFAGKYMLAFQGVGHFHAWSDVIDPSAKFRIINNADNTISLLTHKGKYATTWASPGGLAGSDTPLEGSRFELFVH